MTHEELNNFIRTDLRDFWYPATARRALWLRTIWVDLGPITLARATVTLRDGRLITKAEALTVLTDMGAATALVDDIGRRRKGESTSAGPRGAGVAANSRGGSSKPPSTTCAYDR